MTDRPDPERGGAPGGPEGGDTALAAEYVLHLMDEVSRAEFEARLAYSAELRAEVAFWEAEFAAMADAEVAPIAPPARTKAHMMNALFPREPAPPVWRRAGLWQALTAVLAGVAFLLGWELATRAPGPVPLLVGEIAAEDEERLRLLAVYDAADGTLRLSRTDGVAPPGRVLELWGIPGEDAAPVSLGLLSDSAEGAVTLPPELRGQADALTLAISEEPPGGSPTGAPTGEVLAVGQLTGL